MAFLAMDLFSWNFKNADISIFSKFLATFFQFFFTIEKFCHIVSTCQVSNHLDHSNRNYRGQI